MRRFRYVCDCGAHGDLVATTAAARSSGRAHDRDQHGATDTRANWAAAKLRYPAARGISEQQWVDRWNERPELFERLVDAFVKVARSHPLPRRQTDPDHVAI